MHWKSRVKARPWWADHLNILLRTGTDKGKLKKVLDEGFLMGQGRIMKKMKNKTRREPLILRVLENIFEKTRKDKGAVHPYPYEAGTNTIRLPSNIEYDLHDLVQAGNKAEAVKRVTQLTGAGLRVSKDYVDSLVDSKRKH